MENDRPVPLDERRERRLGRLAPGREPLQELTVGQLRDPAEVEEAGEGAVYRVSASFGHGPEPRPTR